MSPKWVGERWQEPPLDIHIMRMSACWHLSDVDGLPINTPLQAPESYNLSQVLQEMKKGSHASE
jgi:hypothetical protein